MNVEGNLYLDGALLVAGAVAWHYVHKGTMAFYGGVKSSVSKEIEVLKADVAALRGKVSNVQSAVTHVASTAAAAVSGTPTVAAVAVNTPQPVAIGVPAASIPAVAAILNPPPVDPAADPLKA